MKGHGFVGRHLRIADAERKSHGIEITRAQIKKSAAVVAVTIVVACLEREVSGAHDGSLLSLLAPYLAKIVGAHPG